MSAFLNKWVLPLALFGTAVVYWSFDWPNNSTGPVLKAPSPQVNGAGQTEFYFSFDLASFPSDAVNPDQWLVCATFNDGTYWTGTRYSFEHTGFVFDAPNNSSNEVTVTAELTPNYDDDKTDPGVASRSFSPTIGQIVSGGQATRSKTLATGKSVLLESSLNPSPNNVLTYLITYQNLQSSCVMDGTLEFYFDPSVLEFEENEAGKIEVYGAQGALLNPTITEQAVMAGNPLTPYSKMQITFDDLALHEQRSVFVRCTTQNVSLSAPYHTPWVDFTGNPQGVHCLDPVTSRDELPSQHITDSHDPNSKTVAEQEICVDQDYVTFTITFQNDGPDATEKVIVTDELHWLLKNQAPTLIAWSTQAPPAISHSTTDRKTTFTFDPLALNGMRQNGLGSTFTEADTRATFTFRCEIDDSKTDQYPCNAILNRAWIQFDCNPVMPTGLAIAHLNCTSCDLCELLFNDTTVTVTGAPVNTQNILSPLMASSLLSSIPPDEVPYAKYLWYPAAHLNQPTDLNPQFNNPKDFEYTLVYSNSCNRRMVNVVYENPCNLAISIDDSGVQIDPCDGTVTGQLVATATGTNSGNLQWHECDSQGAVFTRPVNNLEHLYYFGVTDQTTGCTAEIVYALTIPACNPWEPIDWTVVLAAIAFLLAVLLFWGRRFFKKM